MFSLPTPRTSFRTKLIIGATTSVVAVVIPIYLLDLNAAYRQQQARLSSHADLSSDLLSQTLAGPLWDFNYSLLDEFFQSFAVDPLIVDAQLFDTTGDVIANYTASVQASASPFDVVTETSILQSSDTNQEVLGRLEMTFSGAQAESDLIELAKSKLVSLALILILSGLVLYLALGHLLLPITKLISAISAIREGDLERPIPGIRRSDEIGSVANALEKLRQAETEVLAMREEQDVETQRERYRLARALESTADGVIVFDEHDCLAMQNKRAELFFGKHAKNRVASPRRFLNRYASQQTHLGGPETESIVCIENDDDTYDLRVRVDPILDESGTELGHVLLASDVTEQHRQRKRADFLARHDGLTGLANRRVMDEALAKNVDQPVGLLLGDLDKFKQVNDRFGHPTGDALLTFVADCLRKTSDEDAVPLRLGGDEFAVLLKGEDARERLKAIGNNVLQDIARPTVIDGRKITTGMSFGLAVFPDDTSEATELPSLADMALYSAKNAGRGNLKVFREALKNDRLRELRVENELVGSFEAGHPPWPVFQRQTHPETGEILGFEALARWTDSKGAAVPPDEFIAIAEEAGIIRQLTIEMLNQSLSFARDLGFHGFTGRVAINFSPAIFSTEASELVRSALVETGCDGNLVEIEITEHVLMSDNLGASREISALREMGVTVALDDFGIGYSSLGYLKNFPVDKIKIDRSFVSDLKGSQKTCAIVKSIVQLAHALGMTVTGEGAETETEREKLFECGVDAIQGWVDGKPQLADATMRRYLMVA